MRTWKKRARRHEFKCLPIRVLLKLNFRFFKSSCWKVFREIAALKIFEISHWNIYCGILLLVTFLASLKTDSSIQDSELSMHESCAVLCSKNTGLLNVKLSILSNRGRLLKYFFFWLNNFILSALAFSFSVDKFWYDDSNSKHILINEVL